MMRFSIMKTMASVVVAFMVLGYPVIGQTKDCGISDQKGMPILVTKAGICVISAPRPDLEMVDAEAQANIFLDPYGKLVQNSIPRCTEPCTKAYECHTEKDCVPDQAGRDFWLDKISCQGPVPDDPEKPFCQNKQKRYDCSRNIIKVTCPCRCNSDLVDLDEFTATPQNDGISLTWTTKTELDSQGFRIWRGTPDLGKYCGCSDNMDDYKQITITTLDEKGNPTLIPATGSTTSGSNYAYLDKDVKPGIPYCYALEDIDSNGESKFYYEYITFTPDAELEQSTQ